MFDFTALCEECCLFLFVFLTSAHRCRCGRSIGNPLKKHSGDIDDQKPDDDGDADDRTNQWKHKNSPINILSIMLPLAHGRHQYNIYV